MKKCRCINTGDDNYRYLYLRLGDECSYTINKEPLFYVYCVYKEYCGEWTETRVPEDTFKKNFKDLTTELREKKLKRILNGQTT